jgi:hypothetical protein
MGISLTATNDGVATGCVAECWSMPAPIRVLIHVLGEASSFGVRMVLASWLFGFARRLVGPSVS